jgi:cyclopropane-fatty-acyl-phospholipid synthase
MRHLLKQKMAVIGTQTGVCFRVVYSDGTTQQNHARDPDLIIRFRQRRAEWNAILFGHIGLLEAYFNQSLDIEGNIALAFRAAMDSNFSSRPNPLVRLRNRWHEFRFNNNTVSQAKANAEYHYSVGTAFYRYWLDDPYMMYTCAYWKAGTQNLEQAQQNKLEHVCRKLQLKPGEQVADIGCGWGGFMHYAHEHYGVDCVGYNTTGEQVRTARALIEERGLADHLSVVEADYREVDRRFDKVAHIGVLEHAGRDSVAVMVRAMADCLKPGGLGVLHFIGHVDRFETEFYIRKHIFPGGWIPSLTEALNAMAANGLEILDIENLRRSYALTLDEWAERFERCWPEIRQLDRQKFDESFYRTWRTYLYSCSEMFRSRNSQTHLFQITFSKGNVDDAYPMDRKYLYAADCLRADDGGQR